MGGGRWGVEGGRWKVEGGRWRPEVEMVKATTYARKLMQEGKPTGLAIYLAAEASGLSTGEIARRLHWRRERRVAASRPRAMPPAPVDAWWNR